MTGIIDKVKDALHKDHSTSTTHTTGTTGTTGTHTGTGVTGTHTTGSTNAGPHNSNVANKVDPRVDSDLDGSNRHTGTTGTTGAYGSTGTHTGSGLPGTHTTGSTNAGPHSSNAANKLDPRVDSDLDGSNRHTGTTGAYGTTGTHSTGTHTGSGVTGTGYGSTTTAGPHSSNLANKADPRVDSDLDGSNRHTGTTGAYGTTGTHNTSSGLTGNTHSSTTTAGPHNSNLLNKVDPRVDSDRDGSRNLGANTGTTGGYSGTHTGTTGGYSGTHIGNTTGTHTGTHGGLSSSTNAGPHNSNVANKVDPRVDSDLDGRGNRHGATTGGITGASGSHATAGSGTAQNTAGPHNSDLLNKIDPRVDSDRDGSKTVGGNKTHA